jgi:hypothetical protein
MRLTRLFAAAGALSFAGIISACGGSGGTDAPPVGPPASIAASSGSQGTATAGQTTPLTLVAKVSDAGGHVVSGASITWSTAFGSITPASASTDANGQSTAQWTPGTVAGAQTAAAAVSGLPLTASFTATVNPGAVAKLKVSPDTVKLVALGATGQITTTATDAFDNTTPGAAVTYTSRDPSIATVSTTGLVTAVANGKTMVDVASGTITAPEPVSVAAVSQAVQCDPAASVTLTVGQARTFTGAAAGQICVTGALGAEFVAIPFYATGNGGSGSGSGSFSAAPTLQLTMSPGVNTTVTGPPTPNVSSSSLGRASVSATGERVLNRDVAWEAKFRSRVRREFSPMISAARKNARQSVRGSGARLNLGFSAATVPAVGSTMQLNVNVDASCATPANASQTVRLVNATVKAVSTHAIVVDDTRNPTGGFTDADFQSFAATFDAQVWAVDSTNFGAPTDIDDNGNRVIIFFTRAVNELTPANSSSFVGGFFFGRDLFQKTDPCDDAGAQHVVGSNQAEMFYMLTPDPNGAVNNNIRATSFVKSITIGTIAHEFQHLINFGRHLITNPVVFSAFEVPFLDEGLAHMAEELNYYAATGRNPRTNLDAATATNTPGGEWAAFGQQNAVRFREYLKNPDRYPPYSVLADTSLAVRGGIWSFLRYATDRRSSSVPDKTTMFQLVNPTSDVNGIANLSAVFGSDVLLQMRDWAVSNYVDDLTGVTAFFQQPSWNSRSVETFVNNGGFVNGTTFPLKVQSLVSLPILVTLADGGAAYLRFGVGNGSIGGATVTASGTLPQTLSITVVRTK